MCKIEGCYNIEYYAGLCRKHYKNKKKVCCLCKKPVGKLKHQIFCDGEVIVHDKCANDFFTKDCSACFKKQSQKLAELKKGLRKIPYVDEYAYNKFLELIDEVFGK